MKWSRVVIAMVALAFAATPVGAAITLVCTPDATTVTGGDVITVECFISNSDTPQVVGSTQIDLPCSLPAGMGSPSGSIDVTSISVDVVHGGFPGDALFSFNGFYPISTDFCRIGATPVPGGSEVTLQPGDIRYLGTYEYTVSACALGEFIMGFEGFTNPPDANDSTKIREGISGFSPLVPFSSTPTTLAVVEVFTIFVDENATGAGNGLSWTDAYTNLQDALAKADAVCVPPDIWVAAGTYKPDQGGGQTLSDRTATFQLINGVAIYGGFLGTETALDQRDPAANETTLTGDLTGDDVGGFGDPSRAENSYHVVTGSGIDATAVLDGFTIEAGNADAVSFPNSAGGGMFTDAGSPTLTHCVFTANSAKFSGGMHLQSGSPTLTHCSFIGNAARPNGQGGGIGIAFTSSPRFTNCLFSGNSAAAGAGVSNCCGSTPTFTNCTFSGNSATDSGGGMLNFDSGSDPTLTNCTFSGNSANNVGGGMFNDSSGNPMVTNSVLWGNVDDADGDGGGPFMDESAQIHTASGMPVVNYSIVQGGWTGAGGTGNSAADPVFIDADGPDNIVGTEDDNFRLMTGSPAIDAADNTAVPADTADLDNDADTAEATPIDLGGIPRFIDDPLKVDTGVGTPPIVDMGAFEFFPDCNGNGQPDICDVDCAALGGDCAAFSQCGLSTDCNSNNILDSCDLNDCAGAPACDDCNLTGLPDECDILLGTSLDVDPADGVPDECIDALASGDWNDPANWPLGGLYPDTVDSAANLSVSIGCLDLFLNETINIESLILLNCGILRVTQTGVEGDLNIDTSGGILAQGLIEVSGTDITGKRTITSAGPLVLGPGGAYRAVTSRSNMSVGDVSAALNVAGTTIMAGNNICPMPNDAGTMILDQSMTADITGDFVMDGTGAGSCLATCGFRSLLGGLTRPPRFVLKSNLLTTGNMTFIESVDVTVTATGTVTLLGNFINLSTTPECITFDGELILANTTARSTMTAVGRTFETAGRDRGPSAAGYNNNFEMGTIRVATGREVVFENKTTNTVGVLPGDEVLYVETLIFQAGSNITINNAKVYYTVLIDNGVVPVTVGSGALEFAGACQLHGDVFPFTAEAPNRNAIGNCVVDIDDVLTVLSAFSAANQCDPVFPSAVNLFPCGEACETGIVDIDDILSLLSAFSGTFGCGHPTEPGACCLGGSSCQDWDNVAPGTTPSGGMSRGTCNQLGGIYQGDGTTCADMTCP